jgi:hypothetical protein
VKTPCNDSDLTFYLPVYRNYDLADACLRRLRTHFPGARVIIRSDGDDDPRYPALAARHGTEYRAEVRLFPIENGGAAIARMLELFLERSSHFLFKIDPDTVVHRRFAFLPAQCGLFGTVMNSLGSLAVQGGCLGLTIDAVRRIDQSGLLRHPDLKNPGIRRDESSHWRILARRAERCGLSSFDWTLGWVAAELQIPVFDFPEVHCTWKTPVDNSDLRYAITHPAAPSHDSAVAVQNA